MSTRQSQRVAMATAYVRSRFYPPLPAAYGALAVRAVDACNNGRPFESIAVGHLPVIPARAYRSGRWTVVTARDLVDALRLWHMVDDASEED